MIMYEKCSKIIKYVESLPLYCNIDLYVPFMPPLFFSNILDLIKYLKKIIIYTQDDIYVRINIKDCGG